jgi:hypothetical protein
MKNPNAVDYEAMNAYALGYFEGRVLGVESHDQKNDKERYFYKQGYDRGVVDFCEFDEGKS